MAFHIHLTFKPVLLLIYINVYLIGLTIQRDPLVLLGYPTHGSHIKTFILKAL
jgi:hypothetical protein